jgi:hypothetical protein
MQYVMVLLLMVGVIVLMVAAVLGFSYALGAYLSARGAARSPDPCVQCESERDWYEELPIWKRTVVTAWWLTNRYQCAAKGCK